MSESNSTQVPPRITNETGNVYGKLTVLGYSGKSKSGDSLWQCRCECGTVKTVARGDLRKSYGGTKSCGCGRSSAYGMCNSPEYTSWKGMKRRCYSRKDPWYHLYGGRGITVCDRWRHSFASFFDDMGPKPFPEASVDRIDNEGHYTPENCRWASKAEQSQNSRKARMLTCNGETMCLRAWARRLGIMHSTIRTRLKRGWSVERALTTPANPEYIHNHK